MTMTMMMMMIIIIIIIIASSNGAVRRECQEDHVVEWVLVVVEIEEPFDDGQRPKAKCVAQAIHFGLDQKQRCGPNRSRR